MEKAKINNQIVCMRKFVKQAKVHVINKLTKEIKRLQNRKGNEKQIQKAKRKAGRFLECLTLLKKIKPDDVSKLALSKSKNWNDVLHQKNSSLQDRCIAMLANYKAVQEEVEAFYSANEGLVSRISYYITEWDKKNKPSEISPVTNKKSSVKKSNKNIQETSFKDENLSSSEEDKVQTIVETKTKSDAEKNELVFKMPSEEKVHLVTENSEEEEEDDDDGDDSCNDEQKNLNISKLNSQKISVKNVKETKHSHNDENEKTSMKAEKLNSSSEESELDENNTKEEMIIDSLNDNNITDKKLNDNECDTNKVHEFTSAKDKVKTITLLNLNELEGLDEIPVSNPIGNDEEDEEESSEDEMDETSQDNLTDPFFLGSNKDSDAKDLDDSSKDSDTDHKTKNSVQFFNNKTRFDNNNSFHKKDKQFTPKNFSRKSSYNDRNFSKGFKNKQHFEKSFKREKFNPINYNKFQENNMKNNKKDFNVKSKQYYQRDTYDKKDFGMKSKSYGNKDNSLKSKVPYKKDNASEHLHPSWEAKRKQKELLNTSFQGKRMVFND